MRQRSEGLVQTAVITPRRPVLEPILLVESVHSNTARYRFEIQNTGAIEAIDIRFEIRRSAFLHCCLQDIDIEKRTLLPKQHMSIVPADETCPANADLQLELSLYYRGATGTSCENFSSHYQFIVPKKELTPNAFQHTKCDHSVATIIQPNYALFREQLMKSSRTIGCRVSEISTVNGLPTEFIVSTDKRSLRFLAEKKLVQFQHTWDSGQSVLLQSTFDLTSHGWHTVECSWGPTAVRLTVDGNTRKEFPGDNTTQELVPSTSSRRAPTLARAQQIANKIRTSPADHIDEPQLRVLLAELLEGHPIVPYTWENDGKTKRAFFYRGRSALNVSAHPCNISQLLYPRDATKINSYGRCNKPHTAVLYVAATLSTVLLELNGNEGDSFYIVRIRPRAGKVLSGMIVGDLHGHRILGHSHFPREFPNTIEENLIKRHTKEELVRIYFIDAFLSEMFRSPTADNYRTTSAISERILANGSQVHALGYPSVRFAGKTNFAILPSSYQSLMECFECFQVRVNKVFGYGIYSPEILFHCDRLGAGGEIHWQPYDHGPEDYVF